MTLFSIIFRRTIGSRSGSRKLRNTLHSCPLGNLLRVLVTRSLKIADTIRPMWRVKITIEIRLTKMSRRRNEDRNVARRETSLRSKARNSRDALLPVFKRYVVLVRCGSLLRSIYAGNLRWTYIFTPCICWRTKAWIAIYTLAAELNFICETFVHSFT